MQYKYKKEIDFVLTFGVPGVLGLTTSMASASFFCLDGESGERLGLMRALAVSELNTDDTGSDLMVVSTGRG